MSCARAASTVQLGKEIPTTTAFDLGVLSPGINPKPRRSCADWPLARVPLLGELEMASRVCQCPIVAITGTNGKTTTTELVHAVLAAGRQADQGFRQYRHGLFRRGARERES